MIFRKDNPGPCDTSIVRYMSLSAFFLLLCGRAFLPSLRRLQEIDKFEGRLPNVLFPFVFGQHIKKLLELHEELEDFLFQKAKNARGPKVKKIPGDNHNHEYFGFLADAPVELETLDKFHELRVDIQLPWPVQSVSPGSTSRSMLR